MTRLPGQDTADRYQRGLESMIAAGTRPERPSMTAEHADATIGGDLQAVIHRYRCVSAALDAEVAPGVYRLTDEHHVYAVPSASTDRIHQITVNTRTGAMRCDGPRCDARTCSHQRRVLAARAGF